MLTLSRSNAKAGTSEPLPTIFPPLERAKIQPRYGQVTMIAAQPNAGKSMTALWMAVQWAKQGLWGLYFSADTDEDDTKVRAASMLTGEPQEQVERGLYGPLPELYLSAMEQVSSLRFSYATSPTVADIELEMAAYEEVFGAHPEFVCVDNLMNVFDEASEGGKESLNNILAFLKHEARRTGTAFIVLHHCSEANGVPSRPPRRSSIQQKVAELPELILTLAYDAAEQRLGLCAVKNRRGPADPEAERPIYLFANFARCYIGETRPWQWAVD